ARSQCREDSGWPLAWNERKLRETLVGAADDQHVDVIDGRRVRLDQHLAGAGTRHRGLAGVQRLRRAELIDDNRAHQSSLPPLPAILDARVAAAPGLLSPSASARV